MDYLEDARKKLDTGEATVDGYEKLTKGMVGVGVGGSAVAAVTRAPADVVLGLVSIGGIGYTANKTNQTSVQSDIITAGKRNLVCIEQTARAMDTRAGQTRPLLLALRPRLDSAITLLRLDLEESRKVANVSDLADWQAKAESALPPAVKLLQQVDEYLANSDVGLQVFYAVDKTLIEVNTQLRRQALDVDAIGKAGSIFTAFVNANKAVSDQAKATSAKVGTGTAMGQSATKIPEPIDKLMKDLNALAAVVQSIASVLPPAQVGEQTKVSDCVVQMPGESDIVVEPAGTITLVPGGQAVNMRITAYGTWTTEWIGAVPSAAQLVKSAPSSAVVSLFAPAGAPSGSYTFYVQQNTPMKRSGNVEIRVAAPEAKTDDATRNKAKTKDAASNDSLGTTDGSVMKDFLDWRLKLGLDDSVKSKSDPKWATRVRVLESCLKLPVTGETSDELKKKLAVSTRVTSNGDCPTPLPVGSTTSTKPAPAASAPAAASSAVPVPPPPKL